MQGVSDLDFSGGLFVEDRLARLLAADAPLQRTLQSLALWRRVPAAAS